MPSASATSVPRPLRRKDSLPADTESPVPAVGAVAPPMMAPPTMGTTQALSYGGTESLTHYLKSFLAELDLCLAICGFKDIASLKEAGCEQALTFR